MKKTIVSLAVSALISTPLFAFDEAKFKEDLSKEIPWVKIENIEQSPVEGFVFVDFNEGSALVSKDGTFIINGDLVNVKEQRNISEERRAVKNKEVLETLTENDLITFKAENEKAFVYIFTDPTCPYCRMIHQEVSKLNDVGVTVKYIAYPRSNTQGPGFEQVQAILHSEDRKNAMTQVKAQESSKGFEFADKSEEEKAKIIKDIDRYYNIGNQVGVRGTPAVFLSTGMPVPGYRPAHEIAGAINQVLKTDIEIINPESSN